MGNWPKPQGDLRKIAEEYRELCSALGIDEESVPRVIELMENLGWIESADDADEDAADEPA